MELHSPNRDRAPRIIEAEGRRIEVPHDATEDEINEIFGPPLVQSAAVPLPPERPAQQDARLPPGFVLDADPSALPPGFVLDAETPAAVRLPPERPGAGTGAVPAAPQPTQEDANRRQIAAGVQGSARGIADTIGLVPDITNLGANALLAGTDKILRLAGAPGFNFRFPMVSDEVANTAGQVGKLIGVDALDPDKMSFKEKAAYNVNRFGTQGALTAGAVSPLAASRAASAGASRAPQIGDTLLRAYEAAPARMAAGDAVAGAGAGLGLTASQEIPENIRAAGRGSVGLGADLLAMLAGATGAGVAATSVNTPRFVLDRVQARLPDSSIPYDPLTGRATTNRIADTTAKLIQENAADPAIAAENIQRGANEFRNMGAPMPAVGALSSEPKLMALERAVRSRDPGTFAVKDVALHDAALDTVERIRPVGVEPRDATKFLRDEVDRRSGAASAAARSAEADLTAAEQAERRLADNVRPFAGQSAGASEDLDRLILDKSLHPMDKARRADFDAVPREAVASGEPFSNAVQRIRESADHLPANARKEILPENRLQDFEEYMVRDSEGRIVDVKPMTFGVINDLRPILGAELAQARKAGAPVQYLDNLETLRRALNKATNEVPEAKRAIENYETNYAPIWGRGAGEAYRFRSDFNVDRAHRTASPPSATAGRFLSVGAGAKEKAEALSRIVNSVADPSDQAAAVSAARQYVLSDLSKTIGPNGKIAETSLARWLNGPSGWNDALSKFPTIRGEVEQLLADVRSGATKRNITALQVEQAQNVAKRTQREIDDSALSLTLGREPIKAAKAVLDSGDPKMAMREIVGTLGGNTVAKRAWERAVTDHVVDRIASVRPGAVSEGNSALDFAKMTRTLKQYDGALAELYAGEPEKMNALRRAQKMLEPLAKRAGVSANLNPASGTSDAWKAVEVGLKAHFGVLKGGGIMRTLKIASSIGSGDEAANVQRLMSRMMFDPELASHLLTREVRDAGSPAWNAQLQKIIRRTQAAKTLQEPDEQ